MVKEKNKNIIKERKKGADRDTTTADANYSGRV